MNHKELRQWIARAVAVLPLIPREQDTPLAKEVSSLLRTEGAKSPGEEPARITLHLTREEFCYLRDLFEAEQGMDEESRHLEDDDGPVTLEQKLENRECELNLRGAFQRWTEENEFEACGDAEDILITQTKRLSAEQRAWLVKFIEDWEAVGI